MTTATRPLPEHGTLSRHKHYGCTCDPCRENFRAYTRRRHRLRGYGTWQPYADANPVRQHIAMLRKAGASMPGITEAAGVPRATIARILYGTLGQRSEAKLRTESAQAILGIRAEDCPIPDGARVDGTGTRRRIQALVAVGWGFTALGPQLDIHPRPLGDLAHAQVVTAGTARKVKAGYKRLSTRTPEQAAVRAQARTLARTVATRNSWAPPAAWDDNAIDAPDAHPDWTGHCGTDHGWHTHRVQQLPMCNRCQQAHTQWLTDHAHLDGPARGKAQLAARHQASSRGQDLADDARELLRQGHTREQAAHRLCITPDHLSTILIRHPEPTGKEAAA